MLVVGFDSYFFRLVSHLLVFFFVVLVVPSLSYPYLPRPPLTLPAQEKVGPRLPGQAPVGYRRAA